MSNIRGKYASKTAADLASEVEHKRAVIVRKKEMTLKNIATFIEIYENAREGGKIKLDTTPFCFQDSEKTMEQLFEILLQVQSKLIHLELPSREQLIQFDKLASLGKEGMNELVQENMEQKVDVNLEKFADLAELVQPTTTKKRKRDDDDASSIGSFHSIQRPRQH